MRSKEEIREAVRTGQTVLGIELGSTRIKAVLTDVDKSPVASGSYDWENRYVDHIWTYNVGDIWQGLQGCYRDLVKNVEEEYGEKPVRFAAMGISAMMHGYLAFDENDELLVPFRTWRNTITGEASEKLSELFAYHIPQRWSIAPSVSGNFKRRRACSESAVFYDSGGLHPLEAVRTQSVGKRRRCGMFPVNIRTKNFDGTMLDKFDELVADKGYPWKIRELLPEVLLAGDDAGTLTESGAKLLDPDGGLEAGLPMCPPEGDAGTGMTATNSVAVRTGNVSAGTSVFAMAVLEKNLTKPYEEIDLVTTPSGDPVAMVHCNNCTSDLNAWAGLFKEFADCLGVETDMNRIFGILYNKALEGDADCGGLLAYNYFSGEHITGF